MNNKLAVVDKVDEWLAEAKADNDFYRMLDVHDLAIGAKAIARARGSFEIAQKAKIAQFKAERAAGEWLAENVSAGNPQLSNGKIIGKLPEGVDKNESSHWQLIAQIPEDQFNALVDEAIAVGRELYAKALYTIAQKFIKRLEREKTAPGLITNDSILIGDMREIGQKVPDNSVDLILTDPPYLEENLPLFSDLSVFADRVLRPGGLMLTYSGQIFLPEIYSRLGEHLEYLWTFAIRHTGGAQRIFKANINTAWKPVIAYVKPPLSIYWDAFIDVVSGGMEKELHEWQQSEAEAAYFVEHLTPRNGVVVDPFAGSGTVLVAAKKLGRKYLGIEIDEETAAKASRRLA